MPSKASTLYWHFDQNERYAPQKNTALLGLDDGILIALRDLLYSITGKRPRSEGGVWMKGSAVRERIVFVTLFSICGLMVGSAQLLLAQESTDVRQSTAWAAAAIAHARNMRAFPDAAPRTSQTTPLMIPAFEARLDASGLIATVQPGGRTLTAKNPFFQNLGTNGRTCFTCHQPQTGWTISARSAELRFERSGGSDPLFRLVDGATCPSADVSTPQARRRAYVLLRERALIRVGLPMPANTQFEIVAVDDPYDCTTNPVTGLTGPGTGIVSVYRRVLPATNLRFLSAIMWDGREPSLEHQALDATLGHAQGEPGSLTPTAQQEVVEFESGLYTAQLFDNKARSLLAPPTTLTVTKPISNTSQVQCADNAMLQTGGPSALSQLVDDFFIGINDPLGGNPCGTPFTSEIFNIYSGWSNLAGSSAQNQRRRSISRGEVIFNTKPINITGVGGLNDVLNEPTIVGSCGTCHDTPNVGNHSVKTPLNIGVAEADPGPPALDISGLPVFTLKCVDPSSPLVGQTFTVTDPGRALITGSCADIGKVKGPILRGLAARAPYFHNGAATSLADVVNFYDDRFNIGFTDEEKQNLMNFLEAL